MRVGQPSEQQRALYVARWRILVPATQFAALRHRPEFAELVTLARIANAIRFAIRSGYVSTEGLVAERQRQSSFLLLAASMSEALHAIQRAGKHFRAHPAYAQLVAPLLSDTAVQDLRGDVLKWLRDRAVYHHDADVTPAGISDLEGEWVFAEGEDEDFLNVSYTLADFAVIRALLAKFRDDASVRDAFERILGQTLELAKQLLIALDTLIGQALAGWDLEIQS